MRAMVLSLLLAGCSCSAIEREPGQDAPLEVAQEPPTGGPDEQIEDEQIEVERIEVDLVEGSVSAHYASGLHDEEIVVQTYKLEYADDIAPEDVIFEGHGVKVLVDPKSLPYLDGTELDFVREGLNEGFKFHNPREKDRCGCGESFRV